MGHVRTHAPTDLDCRHPIDWLLSYLVELPDQDLATVATRIACQELALTLPFGKTPITAAMTGNMPAMISVGTPAADQSCLLP